MSGFPVQSKTWVWSRDNYSIATAGSSVAKPLLLALKNFIVANSNGKWNVVGSCNGTGSFNLSGSDFWLTVADLVFNTAGNAHSWFVFKNTAIGTNWQLLMDCSGSGSPIDMVMYVSSSAGFTGGSNTARPTATDEVIVGSIGANGGIYGAINNGATYTSVAHMAISTDGECLRYFVCTNNFVYTTILIEKVQGAQVNQSVPWIPWFVGVWGNNSGVDAAGAGNYTGTQNSAQKTFYNGTAGVMTMTLEGGAATIQSGGMGSLENSISNAFNMFPAVVGGTTAGVLGRMGFLADLYFVSDTAFARIATLGPLTTQRDWFLAGCLATPWTGGSELPRGG